MAKYEWKKTKTIYWSDELNDDFNDLGNDRPSVPENYGYIRKNWFANFFYAILYHFFAKVFLGLFTVCHGIRFKDKKNIKKLKGKGAYIYSNHVSISDAFKFQTVPFFFRRRVNILAYSDSLSIPVARKIVKGLGYLPVPLKGDVDNALRLAEACNHYVQKKQYILIYPEAHIWPYYTKIRNFPAGSFSYPAKHMTPVLPAVTVWRKPLIGKKAKQTVIFLEPIFPREDYNATQNIQYLHKKCLEAMNEVANSISQYEYIKYIYRPKESSEDDKKED